ncbi:MAG: phospholipase D-like domain-containing protein [Anaerolineae bacterium]|nr:phospholipase D-like domain-containing protein [Anaerolineae bacterium]
MTKKKSKQNPIVSSIIAVVVVIVGAIFYAVTGIDLTDGSATPEASSTQVASVATPAATGDYEVLTFEQGSGARSGFWQVYFTSPINTRDRSQYQNGVDTAIAEAIDVVQNTLDIAAFEMNNEVITDAILRAHERGVAVRIVTDNEHGIEDDDTTLLDLELEGIDIIDDGRSALMHNKFMIMDGITVWMGSMNYTTNGVYRNNNNMLVMRSPSGSRNLSG